jgi:methyl-accepting chemotaxis protein
MKFLWSKTMRFLFSPAISLMNRLRFGRKFAVMATLAALLVAVLFGQLIAIRGAQIDDSRQALAGLPVVTAALSLVREAQQHRGLSSGVLGGSDALEPRRSDKEQAVAAALAALEGRLPERLRRDEHWVRAKTRWAELQQNGMEMSATLNFAEHSQFVDDLLIVVGDLADHYRLTNDPDTATYYLLDAGLIKLPAAIEAMAQVRGKGTGVLARKAVFDEERILLTSKLAEVDSALRALDLGLSRIVALEARLGDRLGGPAGELQRGFAQIAQQVRSTILLGNFSADEPRVFFDRASAAIDRGYGYVETLALPAARERIEARIDALQGRLVANTVLILAGVALIAWIVVGAFLAINDGVGALRETAARMARGDLSVRAPAGSRDEVGEIARSFNEMGEAMRTLVGEVAANADAVLRAAQALEGAATRIAAASGEQSEAATSMAAAVEEMTVGIDHISRNAEEADRNTRAAGELSRQGAGAVAAVVREMNDIAGSVQDSAQTIGRLGEASKRISTIVGTIREIADQTNLLALNAAIEAARAGEAGRGFAVVADEVRKLAERTALSTREIGEIVRAIEGGTGEAVAAMNAGVERVASGVLRSREAGENMDGIDRAMREVVHTVAEISGALREQSAASTDLAQAVERIARQTEQNNAVVGDNARTTEELRQLAESLQREVARFRLV